MTNASQSGASTGLQWPMGGQCGTIIRNMQEEEQYKHWADHGDQTQQMIRAAPGTQMQ